MRYTLDMDDEVSKLVAKLNQATREVEYLERQLLRKHMSYHFSGWEKRLTKYAEERDQTRAELLLRGFT